MNQPRLTPKRLVVQWLSSLLILLIPFVRVGGESLLRLDASSRTLHIFGAAIRIEEFYLLLIITLLFVVVFLFVTMVFGRVWCGWLCPQTTLTDLVEAVDRRIGKLVSSSLMSAVLRHAVYLFLAFLVSSNLIWYFIPPAEYFQRLAAVELGIVAGISLVAVSILVWSDLVFIRRYFCKAICPYGRIQLMAMDANTLMLEFDPVEAHRCIRCNSCVKVCPTGIDIRKGLQVECINCGRCLDACRTVLNRLNQTGIMHYTFGHRSEGGGRPVNARSMLLAAGIIVLFTVLAIATTHRSEATIKISRGGDGAVRRLPDGAVVNFYTAYLENRSREAGVFTIAVVEKPGYRVQLLGPTKQIRIAANENRRVDFMAMVTPAPPVAEQLDLHLERNGFTVAVARLPLLVK